LGQKRKMKNDIKTVIKPSIRKIHLHPLSPDLPSKFSMAYASKPEKSGPARAKLKKNANRRPASFLV
jgi:hypothetical protein